MKAGIFADHKARRGSPFNAIVGLLRAAHLPLYTKLYVHVLCMYMYVYSRQFCRNRMQCSDAIDKNRRMSTRQSIPDIKDYVLS